MKVYFVFSLESFHRGDSNEYTQYTIFNIKKKITLNHPKSAVMFFFSKRFNPVGFDTKCPLGRDFEAALVNEPSVFEPLKFYYNTHDDD